MNDLSNPTYPIASNLFKEKKVVVTASAGAGIGFATAKRFLEEGAEILVNKRITNTLLPDPVPPESKKFNWLESLNVLKILTSRLDLPKKDIEKHFLNKGVILNPESLKSGGNPKDETHSKMVNEILNRAGF